MDGSAVEQLQQLSPNTQEKKQQCDPQSKRLRGSSDSHKEKRHGGHWQLGQQGGGPAPRGVREVAGAIDANPSRFSAFGLSGPAPRKSSRDSIGVRRERVTGALLRLDLNNTCEWNSWWFVLQGMTLRQYRDSSETELVQSMDLGGRDVVLSTGLTFEIKGDTSQHAVLQATGGDELRRWCAACKRAAAIGQQQHHHTPRTGEVRVGFLFLRSGVRGAAWDKMWVVLAVDAVRVWRSPARADMVAEMAIRDAYVRKGNIMCAFELINDVDSLAFQCANEEEMGAWMRDLKAAKLNFCRAEMERLPQSKRGGAPKLPQPPPAGNAKGRKKEKEKSGGQVEAAPRQAERLSDAPR